VVAYMDVDLSTDLEALPPLLDPLVAGTADLSIGSRLAQGAQVRRGWRREGISHIYNAAARAAFHYHVRDAQCGFKAMRRRAAEAVLPAVCDDGWFFDTELIVRSWWSGLRINEVPIHWVEDADSSVRIIRTATDDLLGIARLVGERRRQRGSSSTRPSVGTVSRPMHQEDWPVWNFDSPAHR
jgi:hypothetical protein